jgi:enamine deaminase RidA (YjgF/YER057c/UK114 family)
VLAGVGLEVSAIAKVTTFVVAGTDAAPIRAARARALGEHRPASTLVYVAGLASPDYRYEVEVTAAG